MSANASRRSGGSAGAAGTARRGRRSPRRRRRPRSRHASSLREDAGVEVAERELHRAGQRREVERRASRPRARAYQSASASTSRPSASVLMISIVLPFAARQDVAGPVRVAARACSRRRRRRAITRTGRPSVGDRADRRRSPPRRRPCRPSCPPCRSGRLERDAAGVERDRLADEAEDEVARAPARRLVAEHDQARLDVGCPGATAARAPMPSSSISFGPECLGRRRARARRRSRLRGRRASRALSSFGGLFDEVAGAVDPLATMCAARSAHRRSACASRRAGSASCSFGLGVVVLPAGRVVPAEDRALDERARLLLGRERQRGSIGHAIESTNSPVSPTTAEAAVRRPSASSWRSRRLRPTRRGARRRAPGVQSRGRCGPRLPARPVRAVRRASCRVPGRSRSARRR